MERAEGLMAARRGIAAGMGEEDLTVLREVAEDIRAVERATVEMPKTGAVYSDGKPTHLVAEAVLDGKPTEVRIESTAEFKRKAMDEALRRQEELGTEVGGFILGTREVTDEGGVILHLEDAIFPERNIILRNR
ncbi:hypothetical protein HYS48_01000, partial [Candidatus Woesearchaeota archaeon]|nr:hypothetical protein [Candidatus Woesearchaeota archaeon]